MIEPQMHTDEHGLNEITFKINGCAMDVLNKLGHGFHEKIYENALAVSFEKRNMMFSKQHPYPVMFEDVQVGLFVPDFVVENQVVVELKAIDRITDHEKGQVLNYLKATGLRIGIILNFKQAKLEWQRVVL